MKMIISPEHKISLITPNSLAVFQNIIGHFAETQISF